MAKKKNAIRHVDGRVNDTENTHIELTKELYRSFDFFNMWFCDGKLTRPIIIVASNQGKKVRGWFAPELWQDKQGNSIHEIYISSESLTRGLYSILETLLHEMSHLKNFQANINDCSITQRHNKYFKTSAETFGLIVTESIRYGYAHTELGTDAYEAILALSPNEHLYSLFKNTVPSTTAKKVPIFKSVIVDDDVKQITKELSKRLDVPQKNIASMAIKYYLHCIASGISLSKEFLP